MNRLLILGGSTGGTLAAKRLRRICTPNEGVDHRHRPAVSGRADGIAALEMSGVLDEHP